MNRSQKLQQLEQTQRAREELYDTLGKLRDQLDYAARFDQAVERLQREKPAVYAAAVTGVAVVAGLVLWGVTTKIVKLFRD